jgi:hypothetical protein
MDSIRQQLSLKNRNKAALFFSNVALLVELVLMIVEKSDFVFSMESHVFRVTFLITLLAVLLQDHTKREWFLIIAVMALSFVSYRVTGRNELIRYSLFVFAARDIDLKRAMKTTFYVCLAGFSIVALLSVLGIMGDVSVFTDYGREGGEELRYVFGFGHPNTLYGCVYALMLLWIYVYGEKAGWWQYLLLLLINFGLYKITVSRTCLIIGLGTFVLAVIVRLIKPLKKFKFPYILSTLVTPIACVAFSVWASTVGHIPRYSWNGDYEKKINALDELLNNRIQNLYRADERHSGSLETWKLFSDRLSDQYFDMGWVRLFYWYGIIPGILICILVIYLIYLAYKNKDIEALVLILSLSVYTVIEATFVSVYMGRNFMLLILGAYLGREHLKRINNESNKKQTI